MRSAFFFLQISGGRTVGALRAALLLATCARSLAGAEPPDLADCRAAADAANNAAACEYGFQGHLPSADAPLRVAAAYGKYNDFSCAVRAFLDAAPTTYDTEWVQQFDSAGKVAVPYFYPPARSTGDSDTTSPDGVNSGPVLFMDIAHGSRTEFQAQGQDCLANRLSLARPTSPLRYFWQCSCNVFQHGADDIFDNYSGLGSLHPEEFKWSWNQPDTDQQPNAWERWRPSLINSGLRVACGGSTRLSCSCEHMQSIWFYKSLGFDVATSFVLGLVEEQRAPVCLTRSGCDPKLSPLNDHEFESDVQVPIAGQAYLYLEEPVVLPQWTTPRDKETLQIATGNRRAPRSTSCTQSGSSLFQKCWEDDDGLVHFQDSEVQEQFREVQGIDIHGDDYINTAHQFLDEKMNGGEFGSGNACAIGIYVLSRAERDDAPTTLYLREVVVIIDFSGNDISACNLVPRPSLATNFAVVQMTASRTVLRAVARLDEQLGPTELVSTTQLIQAANVDPKTVTNVQVIYDSLGKLLLPRVEITVEPRNPELPISVRNVPHLDSILGTAPPLPPDHP